MAAAEEEDWRENLRAALAERDITMKAASLKAGLGETYIRDLLEREREPSFDKAGKVAAVLGKTVRGLFGHKFALAEDAAAFEYPVPKSGAMIEVGESEFAYLPVYDVRFAAGAGAPNYDETPIDHYLISVSLIRSLTDAPLAMIGIFQINGDSMEPTINNHDWVFIDRRPKRLVNPGIYALSFEGEGFVKRVDRNLDTGTVRLVSDNPKYKPQLIKRPERLEVIGRVFLSIRRH